jgi:hypothetical protein
MNLIVRVSFFNLSCFCLMIPDLPWLPPITEVLEIEHTSIKPATQRFGATDMHHSTIPETFENCCMQDWPVSTTRVFFFSITVLSPNVEAASLALHQRHVE